ncbi:MAG TPA: hypothetical protein VFY84_20270 [Jiangellales bacterium]|nr:hypothetical protein [Jiangellales bacterium]
MVAVASAAALRFTAATHDRAAVLLSATALVLSSAGWIIATRRYLRAHRSLTADPTRLGPGGTTVAIAAATVLLALASPGLDPSGIGDRKR